MRTKDFLAILIRLLLGFVYFSSGMCKLTGGNFGQLIGPPDLIAQLSEYDLEGFGYLIAVSQVIVGTLILTQRFSLLGLIALVPMNISILTITLSQNWTGTPYVNTFFLLLNLIALAYEYPTWKLLFSTSLDKVQISNAIRLFPKNWMPISILFLTLLAILLANQNEILLNAVASIIMILITLNLFQNKHYLVTEKAVLITFCLTTLSVIHIRFLHTLFTKSYLVIGSIITMGFILTLTSVVQRKI